MGIQVSISARIQELFYIFTNILNLITHCIYLIYSEKLLFK